MKAKIIIVLSNWSISFLNMGIPVSPFIIRSWQNPQVGRALDGTSYTMLTYFKSSAQINL